MHKVSSEIAKWATKSLEQAIGVIDNHKPTKKRYSTLGMSILIGTRLAMPSMKLKNPREFFNQNLLAQAESLLVTSNEYVIIDVDEALRLIEAIWYTRYRVVYEPNSPEAIVGVLNSLRSVKENTAGGMLVAADYRAMAYMSNWDDLISIASFTAKDELESYIPTDVEGG